MKNTGSGLGQNGYGLTQGNQREREKIPDGNLNRFKGYCLKLQYLFKPETFTNHIKC